MHPSSFLGVIRKFVVFVCVVAIPWMLAGCGSSNGNGSNASNGSGSSAPTVATITVSPSSQSIAAGSTQQFTATAKDSNSNTVSGVTFTWASSNTGVATINSGGLATGVSAGTTQITASASGITSSGDTLTVSTPVTPLALSVDVTVPGPVIYAGGNQETITITVTNDQASDVLTATETVGGAQCTTATCGTFGGIVGTGGSGSYTMAYTPPASLASGTTITLTVASNLANSFAGTANFNVHPAGATIVTVSNTGAVVYNDAAGNPGAHVSLLGSGYACPSNGTGGTICGTLTVGPTTTGTTTTGTTGVPFTQTAITYTAPASVPNPPYDRPMIFAISQVANAPAGFFTIVLNTPVQGSLRINNNIKLDVALTGGAPITIRASLTGDSGNNKTINWTLTAGGANCSPQCGILGTPAYTWNGTNVFANITYTPPSTVPASPNNQPTLTATSVDNPAASDSFIFTINDGTCGGGNNAILKGRYAFLLKGGAAANGYVTQIGSFTADGNGNITGGAIDRNGTTGSLTGLSILSAGSSYSVGADGRGCLTLANSSGGTPNYRISLGTVSGGVATQGRMIRFDDYTGSGGRLSGVLMLQNPASFSASQFSGTYAFGFTGVDNGGGRLAGAGLLTSDGAGNLSNISLDVDDNGNPSGSIAFPSGSYVLGTNAANGRGTLSIAQSGGGAQNFVVYMVSGAESLFMATDPLSANGGVVNSGELKLQAGPFSATSLDNAGYVFYQTGISGSGGNVAIVGQVAVTTNGAATVTSDTNNNGIAGTSTNAQTITIASNGRATITHTGGNTTILYLINSSSGFLVGTGTNDGFGLLQKQSAASFTNATFSGNYFFGGEAPTPGSSYDSGSANLNGGGALTGTDDSAGPPAPNGNGLLIQSLGAGAYSFSSSSTPPGKGNVGANTIAYAVSATQVVFITTGGNAELFIAQQ